MDFQLHFFKGPIIGWLAIFFLFLCEEKTGHLSGVGKLQHCTGLILARVFEDDDGVLARRGLQDVAEVGGDRGEDHLVRVQRAPVRARQSHVDKILNKYDPHIQVDCYDRTYMSDVEISEGGSHVEVEVVPAQAVLLRRPHPSCSTGTGSLKATKLVKIRGT